MIGRRASAQKQRRSWVAVCILSVTLLACSTTPPKNASNSCSIFDEKPGWYDDARDSYRKWGVPIHVQLAIIYQESSFQSDAKAPRDTLFGVIPWGRRSSAYGYGQVIDSTWDWYQENTGNWWADRDDFEDVADFVGWYGHMSHRLLGLSKTDAYNQYLAYHEGHTGFRKRSYRKKRWLMNVARRVDQRARRYQVQLTTCQRRLTSAGEVGA